MKLFVTDFDKTLYVDRKISHECLKFIDLWKSEGNLFCIATGRDIDSVKTRAEEWKCYPDYWICNNGAVIFNDNMEILHSKIIDPNVMEKVSKYIYENYKDSFCISERGNKTEIQCRVGENNQRDVLRRITIDELHKVEEPFQIHKRFDDIRASKEFSDDLNHKFGEYIVAHCNIFNVDIVAKGISKAEGIKYLQHKIEEIKCVITIGDSYNDLDMIKAYDGYTLFGAEEDIKKEVRNICESVEHCIKMNL